MATLHEVTDNTKKALLGITIFIIGAFLLYLVYNGYFYVKEILFPTPPIPPSTIYGKLPPIEYPESVFNKVHTYELDTVTGGFPGFKDDNGQVLDRVPVYEFEGNEPSLLDAQNARLSAENAGYAPNGFEIEDNIYRFNTLDPIPKTLDINILTKNFRITSDYLNLAEESLPILAPSREKAIQASQELISNLGIAIDDYDIEKTSIQYILIEDGISTTVDNEYEAQLVRVDFMQKDLSGLPIFYPQATKSTMHFVVSGPPSNPDVVLSNFTYKKVKETEATYPLKDVSLAYEELASGSAYISQDFTIEDPVKIKDVELGYFIYDENQEYLMPIYIFKGINDGFYAYVSAIDEDWIETDVTLE